MRMRGELWGAAVVAGLVLGSAVHAAAAQRSGESLPRARAAAHRGPHPVRASTELRESNSLVGIPLFIGLGITAAVSAVVAVAASGKTDSEG
jgi:hypothetical protein